MKSTVEDVRAALRTHADRGMAEFFPRFFKSDPNNRGEGDLFLGVIVPKQREVAKEYRDLPPEELENLLADPIHECRLTVLIILVNRFSKSCDEGERERLKNFYLSQLDSVEKLDHAERKVWPGKRGA